MLHQPVVPSPLGMEVEAADYTTPPPKPDGDKNDADTNASAPGVANGKQTEPDTGKDTSNSEGKKDKDIVGGHIIRNPKSPPSETSSNISFSSNIVRNSKQKEIAPVANDEDYALLYAYALVTGQLGEEIEKVEREVESLFGVLDDSLW